MKTTQKSMVFLSEKEKLELGILVKKNSKYNKMAISDYELLEKMKTKLPDTRATVVHVRNYRQRLGVQALRVYSEKGRTSVSNGVINDILNRLSAVEMELAELKK